MATKFTYKEINYCSEEALKKYYTLLDSYEFDVSLLAKHFGFKKTEEFLLSYVLKYPKFIDPYQELCRLYHEHKKLIELQAYSSLGYITSVSILKQENGKFPKTLEWGYMENRPLIRFLNQGADYLWENYDEKGALEIYEYLLSSDINDNIGARYYLLALYQELTHEEFQIRFVAVGGGYAKGIDTWFNKNYKKHKALNDWAKKVSKLAE